MLLSKLVSTEKIMFSWVIERKHFIYFIFFIRKLCYQFGVSLLRKTCVKYYASNNLRWFLYEWRQGHKNVFFSCSLPNNTLFIFKSFQSYASIVTWLFSKFCVWRRLYVWYTHGCMYNRHVHPLFVRNCIAHHHTTTNAAKKRHKGKIFRKLM